MLWLLAVPVDSGPPLTLPAPTVTVALPPGLSATKDRLRRSTLPAGGTAHDREVVAVGLGPDGGVRSVTDDQQLTLTGDGDFVVIERGPARHAVTLDDSDPPTLVFGAVVYSGFVPPSGRSLHARLTLDPTLEGPRLPFAVTVTFTGRDGRVRALSPGGSAPGPGRLSITVTDQASVIDQLPSGHVAATDLAGPLDALRRPTDGRPPAAGAGLPLTLPADDVATGDPVEVTVPLAVTGTVTGGTLSGPGVQGSSISGTLDDTVTFDLDVAAAGPIGLDLTLRPTVDQRRLEPPSGATSWKAWAAQGPTAAEEEAATGTLIQAAAVSAHLRDLSPYLTTDLTGTAQTSFHVALAAAEAAPAPVAELKAKPGAIALASVAALLLLGDLELLRRRFTGRLTGITARRSAAR